MNQQKTEQDVQSHLHLIGSYHLFNNNQKISFDWDCLLSPHVHCLFCRPSLSDPLPLLQPPPPLPHSRTLLSLLALLTTPFSHHTLLSPHPSLTTPSPPPSTSKPWLVQFSAVLCPGPCAVTSRPNTSRRADYPTLGGGRVLGQVRWWLQSSW